MATSNTISIATEDFVKGLMHLKQVCDPGDYEKFTTLLRGSDPESAGDEPTGPGATKPGIGAQDRAIRANAEFSRQARGAAGFAARFPNIPPARQAW